MKNRTHIRLVAVVAITILASVAPAQEVQWLQYRSASEASSVVRDIGLQSLAPVGEKPAGVTLPEFTGSGQVFAKWSTPMVEAGYLWIAVDGRNKLFIDSNGNGHLDDEIAIEPYRSAQDSAYFGPVKVVFQGEDGPVTYHLNIQLYDRPDGKRLYVRTAGWYEGAITLNGQKKQCMLIDYNANGAFNDRSVNFDQCDRIQIGETDPAFAAASAESAAQETRFVGNYIEADGTLYSAEIARDGAYVKFAKAEGVKLGDVRLPESVTEFAAGGENGLFIRKPEKGRCILPIGKYRIEHWTIQRQDDKDAEWKLQGTNFADTGVFDVTEAQAAELSIGEPIVCALQADQREPGTYYFRQELKGKLGERIELTRNNARPQPPKVQIKSKDGKYDRTFSFEYG
jgi:hypothetical protein